MKKMTCVALVVFIFTVLNMTGCKGDGESRLKESREEKESTIVKSNNKEDKKMDKLTAPKESNIDPAKEYIATIKTEKGNIVCKLFAEKAPLSVTNFKYLADKDFYKGLTFHRVVSDFVVQGGDPEGTGSGGPGYTIPAEIGKPHTEGALAWARTGDEVNPERRSSGSQFYITLKATPFLDGAYTVISGMDVVNEIEVGDKILDIAVEER